MKQLNTYITEKLVIGKNIIHKKPKLFQSHITDNPYKFGSTWTVNSGHFKKNRIAILLEYAQEVLSKKLIDPQDQNFVQSWINRAKLAYKNPSYEEFRWLCNGYVPYLGNAKFTYDLLKYALTKPDITIPRKQKVEKMLKEEYFEVEGHNHEMNWYT